MGIKVPTSLMSEYSKLNMVNAFRYYLALRIFDSYDGSGKVDKDYFITIVSEKFNVKPKTVLNNLYKLQTEKFIYDMDDEFIYYPTYNVLVKTHNLNPTSQSAIWVNLQDLSDYLKTKALFATAFLSRNKHVSRAKRQEITGVTPKTQLKYDKLLNVTRRFNHAILGEYSDYLFYFYQYEGFPVYVYTDEKGIYGKKNKKYVARQIVNSYETGVEACSYRKLNLCGHLNTSVNEGNYTRLFFDGEQHPTRSDTNDSYFHQEGKMWGFVPQYRPGELLSP